MSELKITKLELITYKHQVEPLGTDNAGINTIYEPNAVFTTHPSIFRVHTNQAVSYTHLRAHET